MKKILLALILILFLNTMSYSQKVGLSFFHTTGRDSNISFGVTFDMIWLGKRIAIGADWSSFNAKNAKNLIGWCFRFHLGKENRITIPIGFDFNNERFYIGLGANF